MTDLLGEKTVLFQLLSYEDFLPFCRERAKQDVFLFWPKNQNILTFLSNYSLNCFLTFLVRHAKNSTLPAGLFSNDIVNKSESELQKKYLTINIIIISILAMNVESSVNLCL